MSRLTRDGTAEPVSRDQILRRARGQGNIHFPCSADHEQDWQPYPVDPYSAICDDHTYIHTYILSIQSSRKIVFSGWQTFFLLDTRNNNNQKATYRTSPYRCGVYTEYYPRFLTSEVVLNFSLDKHQMQ